MDVCTVEEGSVPGEQINKSSVLFVIVVIIVVIAVVKTFLETRVDYMLIGTIVRIQVPHFFAVFLFFAYESAVKQFIITTCPLLLLSM